MNKTIEDFEKDWKKLQPIIAMALKSMGYENVGYEMDDEGWSSPTFMIEKGKTQVQITADIISL